MRSCIRCGAPGAAFANRCKACALALRFPPAGRRAVAAEHDAAARLRRMINAERSSTCNECRGHYPAESIEVDHFIPLSKGGADTADNVRALCVCCHQDKTRREQSLVQ